MNNGKMAAQLFEKYSCYGYYLEAYRAVLGGLLGPYQPKRPQRRAAKPSYEQKYGLKASLPSRRLRYSHCRDFGNARNYGFSRRHLGNDLMGSTGTPLIAVESGVVEALG
jgi:murein DD-endopeptidase MepM/ murein hydrolase activator NlpD